MANDNLTQRDIERIEKYLKEMKAKLEEGEEVSKKSLQGWLEKMGFHYLVDKLAEAWEYILEIIQIMF